MLAPRRVPPCLMTSVAMLKIRMNDTGPEAMPCVEATRSSCGRSRLNENPVPPPDWWISACCFTASRMELSESSTGRTKQASQLLQGTSGVHECRRIREKFQACHGFVKSLGGVDKARRPG